jgi:hypothetical protein
MKHHDSERSTLKPLLAGGLMFALVGLLIDVQGMVPSGNASSQKGEVCQSSVKSEVVLSRVQVAQLLTVPERDPKSRVRDILKEPYCQLPSLEVRAGVAAEREAYPLEFDPQTWLVILYEGDEYAGYQFSHQ